MKKKVAIGIQNFEELIQKNFYYIDKTDFIKEWWDCGDSVTLITRPRRFGKTLNMSMLEAFFSLKYANRGNLFEGLSIWEDEKYKKMQGTYPVISLSFANVKEKDYKSTRKKICQLIEELYSDNSYLLDSPLLQEGDRRFFKRVSVDMDDVDATMAIHYLAKFLYLYYGKKVIILLDEYDTPMQEAYVDGYWNELVYFTRSLFNATFKTNPWMERGMMTGITRISRESIFSDLNNLKVITTTSKEYATAFGFTEEEVFAGLEDFGLEDQKEEVKKWYDGFIFGERKDIYNPWSILNFLDTKQVADYWVNTSSNALVSKLIREGSVGIKEKFEMLLRGELIQCPINEQIVYDQLDYNENAIWSLLVASGYLKVLRYDTKKAGRRQLYELCLTNEEVKDMFEEMVSEWFARMPREYNSFVNALLSGDVESMNFYMNQVALNSFSFFDTGKNPAGEDPERFYHGFMLGMVVDLKEEYIITSNRESGFGRYDVMLEPKNPQDDAIILEFKVLNPKKEGSLEDTVQNALRQIEEKQYAVQLIARGIPRKRIRTYGFAFRGKEVLIG